MKITEIVEPTTQQYDTWYHGTNSKQRANQIIANGIKYDGDWVEKKYKMEPEFAPMKDGVYITKVDLYFAKKDRSLPITLQIREMENGFPTQKVIAEKTLYPANINVSSTAAVATTFTFDNLVFMNSSKDYCLTPVPAGYNDQYQLWGVDFIAPFGHSTKVMRGMMKHSQTILGRRVKAHWRRFKQPDRVHQKEF